MESAAEQLLKGGATSVPAAAASELLQASAWEGERQKFLSEESKNNTQRLPQVVKRALNYFAFPPKASCEQGRWHSTGGGT